MRRPVLAAALLLLAAGAAVGAPASGASPSEARTFLQAGQARSLDVGLAPAGAEEWEAFLSVDGGKTFPVRITPHLPIAERSFAWIVPALPTPEARIRFRFGIGGVERERVSPDRFAIGLAPGAAPHLWAETSPGNAPAPGEEDTLVWVERRGGRIFLAASEPGRGMAPESRWSASSRAWRAIPRQKSARGRPAAVVRRDEPSRARLLPPAVPAPARPLSSFSRLNV